MVKRLFAHWLILAVAIALTAWLMPGVALHGWYAPLWVSALFSAVNLVLGSVVRLATAPIMLFTLGLFGLVVNGLMFRVTAWLTDDLTVDGFGSAFLAALVVTVISAILIRTPLGRAARKSKSKGKGTRRKT
jgi:putative membrane protein